MKRLSTLALSVLIALTSLACGSAGTQSSVASDPPAGCGPGRKTEHFPTTDLWDVVRIIGADFSLNVQPGISLPHTPIQADLSCYSADQAISFLEGLSLQLIPYGPKGTPKSQLVYMVYPSTDAGRLVGDVQSFRFKHALVDDSMLRQMQDALPTGTYVAIRPLSNEVVIASADPYVLLHAQKIISALDVGSTGTTATAVLHYTQPSIQAKKYGNAGFTGVSLSPDDDAHTILIHGPSSDVATMLGVLQRADTPRPSVSLLITVYDYTPVNESANVGLDFQGATVGNSGSGGSSSSSSSSSGSSGSSFVGNAIQINATFNAMTSTGKAKVLSKPNLFAFDDQEANLQVGQTIYIPPLGGNGIGAAVLPMAIDTGVIADITPQIGQGFVTMKADVEVSDVGPIYAGEPSVNKEEVKSTYRILDGEELVIAGLMRDSLTDTIQKFPILGDIPIIGEFFKDRVHSKVRNMLIFSIQPVITEPIVDQAPYASPMPIPTPSMPAIPNPLVTAGPAR